MDNAFIHIGYPKCASTAIQVNFFSNHPDLFYLGPYTGGLSFEYYNKEIKTLVEVDWRIMKDFGYNRKRAISTVLQCHRDFLASGKKTFGFSFESLAFTMHHDIDVTQKAQRIAAAFGPGTKIVIVIRNQFDLIKSLYRELIVVGLSSSFYKFTSDVFYNQFRSFIYDFNFFKMYELYAEQFGTENVLVLPYELLKLDSKSFFETLAAHIGITSNVTSIPHKNESQNDAFYVHFRELNATFRHSMGLSISEPVNQYRYSEYFKDMEGIEPPPNAELEHTIHPLLWSNAMDKSRTSTLKLQYDMPPPVEQWLTKYYSQSNAELARVLKLPLKELGYPIM